MDSNQHSTDSARPEEKTGPGKPLICANVMVTGLCLDTLPRRSLSPGTSRLRAEK